MNGPSWVLEICGGLAGFPRWEVWQGDQILARSTTRILEFDRNPVTTELAACMQNADRVRMFRNISLHFLARWFEAHLGIFVPQPRAGMWKNTFPVPWWQNNDVLNALNTFPVCFLSQYLTQKWKRPERSRRETRNTTGVKELKRGVKCATETYGDQSKPSAPHIVQGSGPEALSNQPGPPDFERVATCCLCAKGHIPLQTTGLGPFLNLTWHWIWTLPVPEWLKENARHLFTGKKGSYQ